jgi:DNA-binding winged helix-turn-helix (wHTH) protein
MSISVKRFYDFGPFRIDTEKRVLLRDAVPVPLAPKALDMLLVLVQHRGQALEKDQLMDLLWPESDVEEANLPQNVSALRKALGETPNDRRYIITIPGRGYRFAAEVKEWDDEGMVVREKHSQSTVVMQERLEGPRTGIRMWLNTFGRPKLKAADAVKPARVQRVAIRNLAVLAGLVVTASTAWLYFNRSPVLTSKDTILLADFDNKTGDNIFDGTLKQGLAIQLQQSPFLNLFPEAQARQTMRLMGRSDKNQVTVETARAICERHDLKALIAGSIAPLGSHYVITLEAINGQTGESLARQQIEAESREQVLRALSRVTTQLREQLGESLSSIQRFDKPLQGPLEQATTSKLEAFKAWSVAIEHSYSGRPMEAIPFYRRAVELDPDFAHAYGVLSTVYGATGRPGLAAEYAEKGYALRDRVSEFEKLRITNFYHGYATGDLNKRIEVLMLLKRTYPREMATPTDLAQTYVQIGQFDQAVAQARESIGINPHFAPAHRVLGWALLLLNRFAEAKDALTQALQQKLDNPAFHTFLYQMAFINDDTAGMQQQLGWASGETV